MRALVRNPRYLNVCKQALMLFSAALLIDPAVYSAEKDRKEAGAKSARVTAPRFEVDPLWPKPLPNQWILGQVIGVDVDAEDNVWIIHRNYGLDPKEVYPT